MSWAAILPLIEAGSVIAPSLTWSLGVLTTEYHFCEAITSPLELCGISLLATSTDAVADWLFASWRTCDT